MMNASDANIVTLKIDDVPPFLRNSEFYKSLLVDSDEEFSVPKECFKANASIGDTNELNLMLSTLRFWGASGVPEEVVAFFLYSSPDEQFNRIVETYASELTYLVQLASLQAGESCLFCTAVESGEVDVVKYLCRVTDDVCPNCCKLAATHGFFTCLRYLHEEANCLLDEETMESALAHGHVDCLQYIHLNGDMDDVFDLLRCAAKFGQVECMRYIHEHEIDRWDSKVVYEAAAADNLECLQYVCEHGCTWNIGAIFAAADHRCERSLAYLLGRDDRNAVLPSSLCDCPAAQGNLACLQLLHQHGCELPASASLEAARYGHQHILRYLQHHGVSWHPSACASAAATGRLECLQFLHEHGCPWDTAAESAVEFRQFTSLRYAVEHGCPIETDLLRRAARAGSFECVRYLHERGLELDDDICELAAANGRLPCLEYAHQHGCRWDASVCTAAVEADSLECLEYAHRHGCPADKDAMLTGVKRGRVDCVDYMADHKFPTGKGRSRKFCQREVRKYDEYGAGEDYVQGPYCCIS